MKPDSHSTDHKDHLKGAEVFVGGLPRAVTESKIREEFKSCGEISEIRMMKDQNGGFKGFCFVRFTLKEAADKAVREKSTFLLDGKKVGVLPSNDQHSLFLGNLPKDWTAGEFDILVHQVFEDVVSTDLVMSSSDESTSADQNKQNRGYAFVKFLSHAAAARAYRMGSKSDFLLGGWHPRVQWAKIDPEIGPEELSKIKIAFTRSLPINADEGYVSSLFEPIGKLEKVVVCRKGNATAAFVHFVDRLDLEKAINKMHGKEVQGPKGGSMFKLQVEIAKPMNKKGKRARDDPYCDPAGVSPSISKHSSGELISKAPKLKHSPEEAVITDPYEAAIVSLPVAVKERLIRIMRLGIATRFDIDIECLNLLKVLPESAAIPVLDQFLLSGSDRRHKGAYLVSLISKYKIEKLRQNERMLQLSGSDGIISKESVLTKASDRAHLTSVSPLASHVGVTSSRHENLIASARVRSPQSPPISDPSLTHLTHLAEREEVTPEPSRQTPVSAFTSQGRVSAFTIQDRIPALPAQEKFSVFPPQERDFAFSAQERASAFRNADRASAFGAQERVSAFAPQGRVSPFRVQERAQNRGSPYRPYERVSASTHQDRVSPFSGLERMFAFAPQDRVPAFTAERRPTTKTPLDRGSAFTPQDRAAFVPQERPAFTAQAREAFAAQERAAFAAQEREAFTAQERAAFAAQERAAFAAQESAAFAPYESAAFPPLERFSAFTPQERLSAFAPQERLFAFAPHERVSSLAHHERVSDLTPQGRALHGASYGSLMVDPYLPTQTEQPVNQVKFDPFTGEPYKFDPFTGQPIQQERESNHPGDRY